MLRYYMLSGFDWWIKIFNTSLVMQPRKCHDEQKNEHLVDRCYIFGPIWFGKNLTSEYCVDLSTLKLCEYLLCWQNFASRCYVIVGLWQLGRNRFAKPNLNRFRIFRFSAIDLTNLKPVWGIRVKPFSRRITRTNQDRGWWNWVILCIFVWTSAVLSDILLQNIAFYTFVSSSSSSSKCWFLKQWQYTCLLELCRIYSVTVNCMTCLKQIRTCACNSHTGTVIIYTNDI